MDRRQRVFHLSRLGEEFGRRAVADRAHLGIRQRERDANGTACCETLVKIPQSNNGYTVHSMVYLAAGEHVQLWGDAPTFGANPASGGNPCSDSSLRVILIR